MNNRSGRPITLAYLIFFVLFSIETWRILFGFIISIMLTPRIITTDISIMGRSMLYVMVASIGWAVSEKPAKWISAGFKKIILKDRL